MDVHHQYENELPLSFTSGRPINKKAKAIILFSQISFFLLDDFLSTTTANTGSFHNLAKLLKKRFTKAEPAVPHSYFD